tara:strand:+ start:98 stop:697 length:600 start_codon:yes stop_codon:yes gene_type:complete
MTEATEATAEATEATAAAVFAKHTQSRLNQEAADEAKLAPHKEQFVEDCRYVSDNWDSCVDGHSTKSGMTKTEARKSFLLAGIGVKSEPKRKGSDKSDFLSDMKQIGAQYDIAAAIVKERDIKSVQYLRKAVATVVGKAKAEAEAKAAEAEAVIDPAARLTRLAAELVDYAAKNGVDVVTLHTLLDKVSGNTVAAAATA